MPLGHSTSVITFIPAQRHFLPPKGDIKGLIQLPHLLKVKGVWMMHSPVSQVWDGSSQSTDKVSAHVTSHAQKCREGYNGRKSSRLEKGRMGNTSQSMIHRNSQESFFGSREDCLVSPSGCRRFKALGAALLPTVPRGDIWSQC